MQLANARFGGVSGQLQGIPAQARSILCPAVRLHVAPVPSSTPGAPQHPPRAPSTHQQPHHPPTTENNALLWREVPSPQSQQQQQQQQRSLLQQHHHLPEAEFGKQLNKEITACSSWRHLRALLHAHAQSMNSVHVSALVSRLAKVSPFTPATGFSEGGHSSNINSSSPRSPSLHTSGAVVDAAASQATAASRSPNALERRALDHFMGEVSQLVSSRLDALDARALSNVLWAVAKLGFCPSHGLLQRFLFAAYVSMQDMQPQEVANLAWALSTMRIHPGAPWTSRLLERISSAAGGMRPQELAHCTWAIQQLLEAHCDAQQQQQQYGSSQAQGLGRPAGTSASLAHSALEVRYLSALHAIQQSAEGALEGFKARELMMLLLSLHRMRHRLVVGGQTQSIPPLMLLLQQAGGQQAGGQQARSMMASHHHLLVAALQSPQLTSHLSSLSPLDVSNLAGLVARDVKLQQQAARQGTVFHTWHMIYEQRAIGQLARAVVADSQSRMELYAPHDLLGLITALSTMQAAGLPRAWLSACAHRIGTTLLISDGSSSSHAIEGPTAAGFPGSVRGVEGSGGVGCLAPGADPRQHICAHATLASLLCGVAKLAARAGIPKKGSSSASGSRSGEASGREYSVAEASRDGCNERSNKEYTVVERGSNDGNKKSSTSSRELMGELACNRSSESNRSSGGWRQGSHSQEVVGSVDFVARRTLEKCLRAALPRMEMHKLAMVAWSLAELQCPWSPRLIATLQQRMHQLLLPFLRPSAAADTTSHPYTRISAPTPTTANSRSRSSSRSSSSSSSPLGSATGIKSTAPPSELTYTSSTPTPPEPLGLNEVSMLLWGVERLQLQLDASTARALAYVTASAATAAVGTQGLQHLQEMSRPSNSMTAVWGQARVRPAVRTGRQVRAPPQAPSSPPTPNTDAQMAPRSMLPPPWNTDSASASLSSCTTSTAGIRLPQSPLSVPNTHATRPTSLSGSPSTPVPNDRSSGGGPFQTSRQASHQIPNQTSYQATATTHQVPHQTSDQASHTTHQPIHTQAPPHTLQRAAAAVSLHSKHSAGYAQGSTAHTAGAHAHRAAALTAAAAAATTATISAVAGSGSSSGRLTGVQDLAWAATSLCTLQAHSRIRVWRGTTKEALEQALATAARFLQPQQLCTIMLALGQAQAHPSEHLLAALLHQSLHLLPSLGPTHMSRLLCGIARLGYRPPPLWLAQTLSHTQALLPECSTEEASWMLWAFAKLRVALPSAWVRTWHQHLLAHALYARHSPRPAVRAAWALHVLRIRLPDHTHALLVQAAAQSGERLTREEALWLLRVAVGWQLYLEHEDWGRLLLQGVLQGKPPIEAVAEMPLRHQHILLSCMAHRHMRWTRCWDEWREVHRALGGRHTAGGSGLVGIWRRTTRPRRWERRLWAHTSKTQRRKQRHLLALTWEAYKATKPRQLCSVWRFREKYWDK